MSITKILAEKDVSSGEKLTAVAKIISVARKAYGNKDATVTSPKVNTPNGIMNFIHLDDDSKVELLKAEVARVKSFAIEYVECTEGADLNRKIEELLSTNGMFVNIDAGTKFDYI
ncbi:MAG: hypothetical protein GY820_21165 [Gammaproteobacteria bacterium]|nr:hypothetical protein [Gammaproteobacteria bacterium]